MSAEIAFDTHRFVKNLTASGFTVAQAEALAHEQIHLLEANLATKVDLSSVKADLEVKIEQVRAGVETANATYDALNALLDAPAEPNDGLRNSLRTPPPWGG